VTWEDNCLWKVNYDVVYHTVDRVTTCAARNVYYDSGSEYAWGLDFISGSYGNHIFEYYAISTDPKVDIYVLDGAVELDHPEFLAQLPWINQPQCQFLEGSDEPTGDDHGTHVAGTTGGQNFGVTSNFRIYSYVVCNDDGSCPTSLIQAGLQAVAKDQNSKPDRRGVVNMSLGGVCILSGCNPDPTWTSLFANVLSSGAVTVVAAGNDNRDACKSFPSNYVNLTLSVGAVDSTITRASFSNWGNCVDIWAPGVNIWSSIPPNTYAAFSGTSMAAPHMTGVVANYIANNFNSNPDLFGIITELQTNTDEIIEDCKSNGGKPVCVAAQQVCGTSMKSKLKGVHHVSS